VHQVENRGPGHPPSTAAEHPLADTWVVNYHQDGGAEFVAVDRRSAITLGTATLFGWGTGRTPPTTRLRNDVLRNLAAILDQTRVLGRTASPSTVLSMVIAQIQTLRGLARDASAAERSRVLTLAGRHAEYAAWMAQESGDARAAQWWIDQMYRFAVAAEDPDLENYTHIRRSGLCLYRNDALGTVDLAERVRRTRSAPPWLRRSAALREAQGYALAGDEISCRGILATAVDLGRRAAREAQPSPALGSTSVPDQHALVTGWCLYDLGRVRDSAEVLDGAVPLIPGSSGRAGARFGVRRVLAHASDGELDHACALAEDLLDLVAVVDSATIRTDLERLVRVLARWRTHPGVADLVPSLLEHLRQAPWTRS
jgi:hypothetical protein